MNSKTRRGKGKPMRDQAEAMLRQHLDLSSRHVAKMELGLAGTRGTGKIHSLETFHKYASSLKLAGDWARERHGLRQLADLAVEQAQEYLEQRAAGKIGQKQLDADRNALEFVTGKDSLERIASLSKITPGSRAYTPEQAEMVQRCQTGSNSLATRVAYEAGLRAHELLTLRRSGEERPSGHRRWRGDRFADREGVRYVVTGKGGLRREVLLSKETAERLEELRLAEPREVMDRGIRYRQVYNISGGNRWAVSFSAASERALGWSTGAHGLRHSYAQERMRELAYPRMEYHQAREIVSQEMGHFRGEIVEVYLR